VTDSDGRRRIRTSVREFTDGGLYPFSLRIVQECDARGLWPQLPMGGRLYSRCLGLFVVIQAATESGTVSPVALTQCTERLYARALKIEVSAEVRDYTRAEYENCVEGYRTAFQLGGVDALVAEFCRRTWCDDADTIRTVIYVSAGLLRDATSYFRQYEAVLEDS
jgi:hypothetical protein